MIKRTIKTCSIKTLAVFLSVLMIFYLIPATAYASLFEASETESVTSENTARVGEVFEDVSRREENVKHFRLEDGTYMAAQYDTAVHTLDENGKWQDIDNTLSASGSEYSTGNARIKFVKKITGNESIFTLHDSNRKIMLSLDGAIKKTSGVATNTETEFDETATTLQKMMTLDKLSSRVIYEDILDGVDLEYIVVSNNVKENIIVKEKKDTYSYSFTLKLNNLVAYLSPEGDVEISDPDSEEVLYIIPAPVVYDANMTYASESDAYYTLETIGQNEYRLTVTAGTEWMNASERAFPITIDPTIYYGGYNMRQMCDALVSQNYPNSAFGSRTYLKVGYDNVNANLKAYVAMRSLPTLPAGSMITGAKLNLICNGASEGNFAANPLTLVAKKITRNSTTLWSETSVTYGNSTSFDEEASVIDYVTISETPSSGGVACWNITPAVVDWYANNTNQGISISQYDANDTTVHTVQFHSSDNSMSGAYTPFFTISYVSTIGVESYYSYQSASAGLAGTGYVNTATGALAFVKPLLSTTDSLMPYTVTMTYNSEFAGKAYRYPNAQTAYSTSYMPYGFKLNINETIIEKKFTNDSAGETLYYIWSDSDGTEHAFFEKEDDVYIYEDEDGLQLTLTMDPQGEVYTLEDDGKTVRTFTQMSSNPSSDVYGAWYLTSITDKNNNEISFTVDSSLRPTGVNLTPNGSSTISFLTLVYNDYGQLSMIRNDTSKEAVVFRYSGTYNGDISTSSTKYLREIVYAHGTSSVTSTNWADFYNNSENTTNITVDAKATYTYDSSGRLGIVNDTLSGYRIDYTYSGEKVSAIQEYGRHGTQAEYIPGQSITLTYGIYNTVIQTSGTDDVYGTADDLLTTYSFDTSGRTVNCYTTDLTRTHVYGASSGQYVDEENEKAKNSLKTSVQKNYNANNYLLNGSFEESDNSYNWSTSGEVSMQKGSYSRSGNGYLRMCINSTNTSASISQTVYLDSGDYSLSLYVVSDMAIDCDMEMTVKDCNSVVVATKNIVLSEGYSTGNFALSELGFTVSSSNVANYTVTIELTGNPTNGVVVFLDDIMLSKSLGATEYDLVQNGNFELTASGNHIETYWSVATDNTHLEAAYASDDTPFGRVMKIRGSLGESNIVLQNIYQIDNNAKNDYDDDPSQFQEKQKLFTLSGWAMGTYQCYSDKDNFAIGIEILYYNGSNETQRDYYSFDFAKNITDWQFISGGFSTDPSKGIIESITIYLFYSGHPGTVYFDGITLVQDSAGTSAFDYNSNGDISSYQNGSNKAWYAYNNNKDISAAVTSDGNIVDYTYDSQNRLKTEKHSKYSYKINDPSKIKDINVTALYEYYYEYDIYGNCTYSRITDLSGSGKYSDSLTVYNVESGSHIFGSVAEEVDAHNNTTHYFYDDTNGRLMATIYPNGEGVSYEYDAFGRLINATPAYINEDSADGYSGRTNAESVTYNYNTNTKQLEEIITATTTYTFIPDTFGNTERISAGDYMLAEYDYNPNNGKLNKLEYGNGHIVEYSYDALDRICEIMYNINGGEDLTTAYSYTYDTAGNLSSIEDHINNEVTVFNYDGAGKLMSSYVYDSETYEKHLDTVAYYDDQSRVSLVLQSFDISTSSGSFTDMFGYGYEYNTDTGFISDYCVIGNYVTLSVTPTYDNLGKTSMRIITADIGNDQAFYSENYYIYKELGLNESALVSQYASRVDVNNIGLTTTVYNYTYDDNGNITEIRNSADEILYKYTYDYLGQLIREDNRLLDYTYVYEYDDAGNITSKKIYSFTIGNISPAPDSTVTYTYGNASWGDLLTNFNGTSITYDTIGNPVEIGYLDLTWEGRRLTSIINDEWFTISYGYNADGIRTYKEYYDRDSNEITRHEYLLNGTRIIRETVYTGTSTLSEEYTLVYLYDETGAPIGIKYRTPSYAADVYKAFFFEKNLQGDIVAIYNEDGVKIGTYIYDAWGNFTVNVSSGVTELDVFIVREYNPYHYRGYYFDAETEWYYLQSRYYNPEWGRFINADGYVSTGTGILGYNMFAYCNNNPIMLVDASGQGPITFFILTVLVLSTVFLSSCNGFELQPGDELDSQLIDEAEKNDSIETFDSFSEALDYSYNAVREKGLDTGYEYGTTIYINKLSKEFLVYGPYTDSSNTSVLYQAPSHIDSKYWTAIGMVHNHPGRKGDFCFSGGDYNVGCVRGIAIFGINDAGITMEDWSQLPNSKLPYYLLGWDDLN